MNVRHILERAVQVAWRYRVLWVWGFLLAFFAGNTWTLVYPMRMADLVDWRAAPPEPSALVIGIIAVVAVVWLALSLFLGDWATGVVIGSISEVEDGQRPTLSRGARIGLARLWTLVGLALAIGLPSVLSILILVAPSVLLFAVDQAPLGCLAACLFLPVVLIVSVGSALLLALSQASAVVSRRGVIDAVRDAWELLQAPTGSLLLLWLTNAAVGCGWGCLGGLSVGALGFAAVVSFQSSPALAALMVVILLPALALYLTVSAALEVFYRAVWTLAYRAAITGGIRPGQGESAL